MVPAQAVVGTTANVGQKLITDAVTAAASAAVVRVIPYPPLGAVVAVTPFPKNMKLLTIATAT